MFYHLQNPGENKEITKIAADTLVVRCIFILKIY